MANEWSWTINKGYWSKAERRNEQWVQFGSLFGWDLWHSWGPERDSATFFDGVGPAFIITAHQRDAILDRLSLAGREEC